MTKKERDKFISEIPEFLYDKGAEFMRKAMKITVPNMTEDIEENIKERTKMTIEMACRILLDLDAKITWPTEKKKKEKKVSVKKRPQQRAVRSKKE